MKNIALITLFLALSHHSIAQLHLPIDQISFDEEKKNIKVQKLSSDQNSSSFAIQIEDSVAAHYHQSHTESVIILEGSAEMRLGEKIIMIKKGDYIVIPEGTVHSVKVLSDTPLKVISVQAPEFKGEDRHYVND